MAMPLLANKLVNRNNQLRRKFALRAPTVILSRVCGGGGVRYLPPIGTTSPRRAFAATSGVPKAEGGAVKPRRNGSGRWAMRGAYSQNLARRTAHANRTRAARRGPSPGTP